MAARGLRDGGGGAQGGGGGGDSQLKIIANTSGDHNSDFVSECMYQ